ncbi:MAG: 4Fe-4S binding protein [Puniceicoccales bacterium]|jgi:NADH-quinone oxidoreductase subunit I|nr:4Fe-4S binding protein [Puniceicoccales bacterium]
MLGFGILRGLLITAKNFVGSYHDPSRLTTIQYPEERARLPENYRNFPFLVYEDEAGACEGLRCVACRMCELECPPRCIAIEVARSAEGKPLKRPAVFNVDVSVCMGCGICVEVCPFDSIKMDHQFEIASTGGAGAFLLGLGQLAKPNSYYHQIRPVEAAAVDEKRRQRRERAGAAVASAAD